MFLLEYNRQGLGVNQENVLFSDQNFIDNSSSSTISKVFTLNAGVAEHDRREFARGDSTRMHSQGKRMVEWLPILFFLSLVTFRLRRIKVVSGASAFY